MNRVRLKGVDPALRKLVSEVKAGIAHVRAQIHNAPHICHGPREFVNPKRKDLRRQVNVLRWPRPNYDLEARAQFASALVLTQNSETPGQVGKSAGPSELISQPGSCIHRPRLRNAAFYPNAIELVVVAHALCTDWSLQFPEWRSARVLVT